MVQGQRGPKSCRADAKRHHNEARILLSSALNSRILRAMQAMQAILVLFLVPVFTGPRLSTEVVTQSGRLLSLFLAQSAHTFEAGAVVGRVAAREASRELRRPDHPKKGGKTEPRRVFLGNGR